MSRNPRSVNRFECRTWVLFARIMILFAASLSTAIAHLDGPSNHYVAENGVDQGDCATPVRPCKSIMYAVSRASLGDNVLVAAGSYLFEPEDPAEIMTLLSHVVPVSGGYSVSNGFSEQVPKENPTFLIGPSGQYATALLERGFILSQAASVPDVSKEMAETLRTIDASNEDVRYVAAQGVDEGDCISIKFACRTIGYAVGRAKKGDIVLVAAGSYQVAPEQVSMLLNRDILVQAGFSRESRFSTFAPKLNPTFVMGPSFKDRDRLAERGFILVQDPKGIAIQESIGEKIPKIVAPVQKTRCIGGTAGSYPCKGIDFLGSIPLDIFSTAPKSANDIWGFVDLNDNREYALIGLRNGTAVVDVTDPENPFEIGSVAGNITTWRDVKVYQFFKGGRWNAYAYVTADNTSQGIQIIDLTGLPERISLAATFRGISSAHNIYMGNTDYASGVSLPGMTAYAAILGSNLNRGAFRIFDLSNPIAPVEVTAPPAGTGYVHDATSLVISDERTQFCAEGHNPCEVYIDYNEDTIDLWDVTDKFAPVRISTTGYNRSAYTHSGWGTENTRFVFIQDELDEQDFNLNTTLRTLDISDLSNPVLSNVWTGPTQAIDHNGFVKGNRYYMSNYRRGLTILDITDPNTPVELAFFDTFPSPSANSARFNGAWGTYPYLPSGTILVSDIEGGLFLLRENSDVEGDPLSFALQIEPNQTLQQGQTANVLVTVHRGNTPVAGKSIAFSIDDSNVAMIEGATAVATDANGKATATIRAKNNGETEVRAEVDGNLKSVAVKVPDLSLTGFIMVLIFLWVLTGLIQSRKINWKLW